MIGDPRHQHHYGSWEEVDSLAFLKLRHCIFEDCKDFQYGVFDNVGKFLRVVTEFQVESYKQEIEDAQQSHHLNRIILENEFFRASQELQSSLTHDLLHAKLRLTGGL